MLNPIPKWMWYPGDYEIYHSMMLHGRREEKSWPYPVVWRLDSCWCNVAFVRTVEVPEDTTIDVRINGIGHVLVDGVPSPCGLVQVPAGTKRIQILVYKSDGLPCAYVDGGALSSGAGWLVDCQDKNFKPVGFSDDYIRPSDNPEIFPFCYKAIEPASIKDVNDGVLYDFGQQTFARLTVETGSQPVRICYGESLEEALDEPECIVRDRVTEGTKAELPARAFRYIWLSGQAQVAAEYEYLPLEYKGSFKCADELINKIWKVCAHTFHLNSREFFLDGIKRDRWVWSGDAYQSYLVNDYLFRDEPINERTIIALRGKDPMTIHLNTIMDYSFYWVISIGERFAQTGNLSFVRQMWPLMESLVHFCLSRTDGEGLAVPREGDWIFIDWADLDKEGANCAEQFLFVKCLETMADCARLLGEKPDQYAQAAGALRAKVETLFWDEAKGAYIDSFVSGKRYVTRHTNLFALRFGFDGNGRRDKIIHNVLLNDAVSPITTPYFKFYEMEAWCEMGKLDHVRQQILDYWGGMIKLGATSIWEEYDPRKEGAQHYAMYGLPYGKSLCHAWGASPIYLLGKYFLGVSADKDGFTVQPDLGGLDWMEGTVPLAQGSVRVSCDGSTLKVLADVSGGKLIWQGQEYTLTPNEELNIVIN